MAGIDTLTAFKLMFFAYGALGRRRARCSTAACRMSQMRAAAAVTPLGPSRGIVYKLAALFSLDSFAGGLAVQSLLALWLFERFDLSLSAASLFFFWSSTLAAFSFPVAAWLSRRIGLINTMVYTHIPSSVFLILAAFSPDLYLTLALLLVRAALSQMDVPTRTSYVMAVVTPAERTAAASVTAVPRSLAASLSPALAGALLATPFSGLPLVACGVLKIAYDLALLYSFRHVKPPEEAARAIDPPDSWTAPGRVAKFPATGGAKDTSGGTHGSAIPARARRGRRPDGARHSARRRAGTGRSAACKFILPLGPGSGVDIGARLIAEKLSEKWGKAVVIENKPGGDAIVAITAFTRRERRPHAPDGADLDLHGASVPARKASL